MAQLLREDAKSTLQTRIGGTPEAPHDFDWPVCRSCGGVMRFLAQIALPETDVAGLEGRPQRLLLFQCGNDPGMCDDWEAESGGNAARLVPADRSRAIDPPDGESTLPGVDRLRAIPYDDTASEETPDDAYCDALDADDGVLGKTGGVPLWIQDDETPACSCGRPMTSVVQLEESGGGGINFGGGGAGYGFVCETCSDQARFLWQCG